jgi:hypothetical protein
LKSSSIHLLYLESSLNNIENDFSNTSSYITSRRPERFTPNDVAKFVRAIDPSFDSLASRFLQEVFFFIEIKITNSILFI